MTHVLSFLPTDLCSHPLIQAVLLSKHLQPFFPTAAYPSLTTIQVLASSGKGFDEFYQAWQQHVQTLAQQLTAAGHMHIAKFFASVNFSLEEKLLDLGKQLSPALTKQIMRKHQSALSSDWQALAAQETTAATPVQARKYRSQAHAARLAQLSDAEYQTFFQQGLRTIANLAQRYDCQADFCNQIYQPHYAQFLINLGYRRAGEYAPANLMHTMVKIALMLHAQTDRATPLAFYDGNAHAGSALMTCWESLATPEACSFVAKGADYQQLAILETYLIITKRLAHVQLYEEETLTFPAYLEDYQVDLCVSKLPAVAKFHPAQRQAYQQNPRLYAQVNSIMPAGNYGEFASIIDTYTRMRANAVAILLVPQEILYRNGPDYQLRQWLLSQHAVYAVIQLATNLSQMLPSAWALLVLKKQAPSYPHEILFINASDQSCELDQALADEPHAYHERFLTEHGEFLCKLIKKRTNMAGRCQVVSMTNLHDANLLVSLYVEPINLKHHTPSSVDAHALSPGNDIAYADAEASVEALIAQLTLQQQAFVSLQKFTKPLLTSAHNYYHKLKNHR